MESFSQPKPPAPVNVREHLSSQEPQRIIPGALKTIQERISATGQRVVVLDDDPTGTQSVHGVPVLTTWSEQDLRWAFNQLSSTFYVLTNSRSLPEREAAGLSAEICARVAAVASETSTSFVIASRSDSTLRGHYPAETNALLKILRETGVANVDGIILCPCFLEAGRVTVDDVHWVQEGEYLVPAGQTEFASDRSFGYTSSNLRAWVEEKSGGALVQEDVASISLRDIRSGGPERIAQLLKKVNGGQPVVVNALTYADLEVVVLGLLAAEESGKYFVYRTGPSLVRIRGGITEPPEVSPAKLYARGSAGERGLVVVGSHVDLTTRQLNKALTLPECHAIELSVQRVLEPESRADEIDRAVAETTYALEASEVIIYTSRGVVNREGSLKSLDIGHSISEALVELVQKVVRSTPLRFVVAKGGITSSDIATEGLGVRRAEVAGTMLPGIVPVWILSEESQFPGLPYVIFPGNVGETDSLAKVIELLREEAPGASEMAHA